MGELEGKVAIVTGASRGIGAAIAERFAAEGAVVALAARTVEPHQHLPGTLPEMVERIEKRGGRAIAIQADITDPGDRERLVQEARDALGPVDILVNNAAASFYKPFLDWTERRFDVAFAANVRSCFDLAQRVVPDMKERGAGWILNISSATAMHPKGPPYDEFAQHGGSLIYGMTKAALDRFSTGIAGELHADGISVNSMSPLGAVMTPGVEALGVVPDEYRASAEPVESMAEAALALCVPGCPTGRVLLSTTFLTELDREIRTLDGAALLG